MLQQDRDKLRELFSNYSPKEIMADLVSIALESANDLSDNGYKQQAQDLVKFAVSLEDLISGRPFLI